MTRTFRINVVPSSRAETFTVFLYAQDWKGREARTSTLLVLRNAGAEQLQTVIRRAAELVLEQSAEYRAQWADGAGHTAVTRGTAPSAAQATGRP